MFSFHEGTMLFLFFFCFLLFSTRFLLFYEIHLQDLGR